MAKGPLAENCECEGPTQGRSGREAGSAVVSIQDEEAQARFMARLGAAAVPWGIASLATSGVDSRQTPIFSSGVKDHARASSQRDGAQPETWHCIRVA